MIFSSVLLCLHGSPSHKSDTKMGEDERFVSSREDDISGKDSRRRRRIRHRGSYICQPPRNVSSYDCKGVAFLLLLLSRFTAGHWGSFIVPAGFVQCKSAGCFLTPPKNIVRHNNLSKNQCVRNHLTWHQRTHRCHFARQKCRHRPSLSLSLASEAKNDFCEELQDPSTLKEISKQIFPQKKWERKKRQKRLRNHSNVVRDIDVNDSWRNKRRRREQRQRGSKSLPTSTVAQILTRGDLKKPPTSQSMPPWLSQYTDEDFETCEHSMNYPVVKVVSDAAPTDSGEEKYATNVHAEINKIGDIDGQCKGVGGQQFKQNLVSEKLRRLKLAMSGIFTETSALQRTQTHHSPSFTPNQIHDVLDSIRVASQNNLNLMIGCADFLYLMLTLEEHDEIYVRENNDHGDVKIGDLVAPTKALIVTREVLVAAAFHYCDCVRARKAGMYDVVRMLMESGGTETFKEEKFSPSHQYPQGHEQNLVLLPYGVNDDAVGPNPKNPHHYDDDTTIVVSKKTVNRRGKSPIEKFGEESVRIAAGAAKLKRAEVMATTVNGKYDPRTTFEQTTSRTKRKSINANTVSSDASILRSFLVSLSEDWRALVIRSAACLYRLKGIVEEENIGDASSKSKIIYSSTSMQTARDALRVYAPLAQRMGMQRLKSEIENTAFRILYRRQHKVASALHDRDVGEMQMIIEVLMSRIQQLLRSDQVFMANVDDIIVSSRVKEPYSLWKKILRYRKEALAARTHEGNKDKIDASRSSLKPTQLSSKWVPDAIALRVVIRGKQMPTENEESLRTREKMLCYFAFQLITEVWPPSKSNIAKDYIKHPKPNGYQSLHYTAALMISGEEWPFEVQIRSEEMHQIAEYGVAAHWDYKLQNKKVKSLPDNSNGELLALPPPASDAVDNMERTGPSTELTQDVVQPILDTTSNGRISSYIEALTTSREILVRNNVFVFISSSSSALDGRIVSLDPSSRLVADVLMQYGGANEGDMVDTISSGDMAMYRNGVVASLDDELNNGDVLTLPPNIMKLIKL
eukprot:CCRYP_009200-RA/>CCRYP_009200-RA protein AED:0.06 eAED:0.06 QI:168/1/1/1/1/1/3/1068/1025